MKSLEQQLAELKEKYVADQAKKGFSETAIAATWKESVMVGESTEQKLSNAKKLTSKAGITESITESRRRIVRNNGASFTESDQTTVADSQDICEAAVRMGCSFREASIILTGTDPGANFRESEDVITARAKRWKEYAPAITDQECRQLAEKQIEP